jgi:diguanylate cyclase (GGDEF)-like protein
MELKLYLRILLRKWWIIVPAFLVAFTSTLIFTFTQVPTYSATATFVVAPASSVGDAKSFVNNLEVLSSRAQIASTYAEVATSSSIKCMAAEALNLSASQKKSLSVESKLRAGTNVIEITVQGSDPVLVRDFANKVGDEAVAYAEILYEVYDLKTLDQAVTPAAPMKPDKALNLALGAILGLVLGGGLALLTEYLQAPLESMMNLGILDAETGAYNKRYFAQRLNEEMSRARRNRYPLSLALMNVDPSGVIRTSVPSQFSSEALRKVTVFLKQNLRAEDVMARLDGTVFAFLLPDMSEEQATTMLEKLQTRMVWTAFEMEKSGIKLNLTGAAGVVAYDYNGAGQDEFLAKANRVLQKAETVGYGKVLSLSADGE